MWMMVRTRAGEEVAVDLDRFSHVESDGTGSTIFFEEPEPLTFSRVAVADSRDDMIRRIETIRRHFGGASAPGGARPPSRQPA